MIPLLNWNRTFHIFKIIVQLFTLGFIYSLLLDNSVAASRVNYLEHLGFSTLPGNRVQLQLDFANAAIIHNSFSTDQPARIVLDFMGTKIGLRKKYQAIGIGVVQGVQTVETHDRTRVVLKLVRMVPFKINIVGKRALVSIDHKVPQVLTPPSIYTPPITASVPTQPVSLIPTMQVQQSITIPSIARSPHIQNIDFRRTQEGAGHIAITLSDSSIMVDMGSEGRDIVLNIPNTKLPKKLDRRLDVLDFSTPISFIDTSSVGANVHIKVTVQGDYEHHAYQTENIYVLEIKEKVKEKQETLKIEERKYEGQLVSFDFQKIDIRSVLSLLFGLPGVDLNMVAGDEVKGSVTLRLKNVPWDQALDIILEARGLGMQKLGNVVMIDLKKNINSRKQHELESQKKIKALEPLRTDFITINYAKAGDIVSLLRTQGEHSFISKRGSVSMDKRTNTIIIQDTAAKIIEIRKLINELDTPVRQVLIEAKIVIATSNFSRGLGVKFGYSANEDMGQGNGVVFGGKVGGDTQYSGGTGFSSGNTASGGKGENLIVSLPANVTSPAAIGLAIGKIGSYLLQLELSAMQSEGNGEVLSSPRIITGNQQEASITQGTEIPYVQSAGVGAVAQVQFKPAVLELKVTPQITPDDRVNLTLSVKKDSEGGRFDSIPSIDTRQVTTNVLVNNGETIVLGGVYERTTNNTLDRVPFFADLPFIGHLFKRRSSRDAKSELLIFVTPKILKETS
ncbi:MAG: type IV pilus secretin PilQ [Gammaproteobacteria bacterium]|nr:MAG: type IV pilus secretin PilQ [Gammaproteobacteria bacterium]